MKTSISSPIFCSKSLILLFSVSLSAQAQDIWTSPNPGLMHLHRTTIAPAKFHAIIVDLRHPGVKIRVTPRAERWKTTSQYAISAKLAGAVNAGSWSLFTQKAKGLAVSGGEIWSPDDEQLGFFAINTNGDANIIAPLEPRPLLHNVSEGVAGTPMLVDAGKVTSQILQLNSGRDARVAIGVSKNGTKLILVTVDGRQADSVGASMDELGQVMVELGAERAINLDGGNSTTMFIAGEGGVVNRPSRGWEREVVTHIGVVAPAPTIPTSNSAVVVETPQSAQALAARPIPLAQRGTRGRLSAIWLLDRIIIGQAREWVVPVGAIAFLPTMVFMVAIWVRRSKRVRREISKPEI